MMKALIAIFIPAIIFLWKRSKKNYSPGPKRLPFLGNLLDLPSHHAHEKFAQYSKDLDSDIVYLDALGVPFIILNSLKACNDLLDKRSNIYSSRFHQTMGYELVDGRRFIAMQPYGDEWREGRRIMAKHLNAPNHQTLIMSCISDFVRKSLLPNLLTTPDDFLTHIRNGVGGSIISLTYGLPIKRVNDPWIDLAEKALYCITSTTVPGKYTVDILPFLKYLPEWFPGAQFQKEAREGRELMERFFREPFEASKRGLADGAARPCFLSQSLEGITREEDPKIMERIIENAGGMFAAGGTDTSVTAVINFIVVLLLFPDVQAKAQAEIDSVIGTGRLPNLEDKSKLPYLCAVLKEQLRWRPVVPAGFPHMSTQDDEYRGYFIPKGSIVVGNTWALMHDEKVFPEPFTFDPMRFLTPDGQLNTDENILDPEVIATFGFGRRICPGITFGLANFWLSAACILTCFNVTPALDEKGEPIPPEFEYLGKETILHPQPFRCSISPRSQDAVALIQAGYDQSAEYI